MSDNDLQQQHIAPESHTRLTESIRSSLEAVLFAYGDPISLELLSDVFQMDQEIMKEWIRQLSAEYEQNESRGIYIRRLDHSYTLSTKPGAKEVIARLFSPRNRSPLTQAAYETLAVVAYNQPVTRSQIEAVRGVGSDGIIMRLTEKNLIRECGNLDAPGRPVLFETTDQFLKEFGLSSIHDLPPMEMLMYGTLRDIESSILHYAPSDQDNQISLEQIHPSTPPVREQINPPIDQREIVDLSSAIFGNQDESSSDE